MVLRDAMPVSVMNLRTTPEALTQWVESSTVETFGKYGVLSERELHSRYEVYVEQYVIKTNIEAEMTFDIAKTMILPAAITYYNQIQASGLGLKMAKGLEEGLALMALANDELDLEFADGGLGVHRQRHPCFRPVGLIVWALTITVDARVDKGSSGRTLPGRQGVSTGDGPR